jgi:possible glycine/D-amino acid oxidase (deaminating)
MKIVEYIIVGGGFAGMFMAHQLVKNKKSFVVFSDGQKNASKISAGMVNPVVLKKFTTFDNAHNQISILRNALREISYYTGVNTIVEEPIHRIFHDEKEQNTWSKKRENENLSDFLNEDFVELPQVKNPLKCGVVNHSFRVDVPAFFLAMENYLRSENILINEFFDYKILDIDNQQYKDIRFEKIIFAEGINVRQNPYFSEIPIVVNKGHHLSIKFDDYQLKNTIKKKHFLFPLDEVNYYYGGTYDRENESVGVDDRAVEQLNNAVREITDSGYKVTNIEYGYRPTVADRRPILGKHSVYNNLFVFNGLGARGLLNGAFYSEVLYRFIEDGIEIPDEVKKERFH